MLIGAAACLGDAVSATWARQSLQFVVKNETYPNLVLREVVPCKSSDNDCLEFKGITIRFLSHFAPKNKVILESVLSLIRFTSTDFAFPDDWIGPTPSKVSVLRLASQTSGIAALLAAIRALC
jgi:hypothetical protein